MDDLNTQQRNSSDGGRRLLVFGRKARIRIAVASFAVLMLGGALTIGVVPGAGAVFTADTANPDSTAAGGWIPAPTGLATPAPAGYGASFTWTSGASAASPSPNPVTGQQLWGASGGSGGSASCGTYALTASMPGPTTTSYTDAGSSGNNGDWWCYEMESTSAGSWTSDAVTFTPVRVGLYPISVVFAGNGDGKIDNGDTITITFNQDVATPAINKGICQVKGTSSNGDLILGFTGSCSGTAAYAIGKIAGITVNKTGSTAASVTTSGSVVTITVTASGQKVSGSGTFTSSTSVTSTVGSAQACTSASAPTCTVTTSGSF